MAFQLKRVVQTLGSTVVVQLAAVGSGVLIARLIGAEDRGHLAHIVAWYSFIVPLALIGIDEAATYLLSSDPGRRGELIGSTYAATAMTAALAVAGCVAAYAFSFSHAEPTVQLAALSFILFAPLFQISQITQKILQTGAAFGIANVLRMTSGPVYIAGIVLFAAVGWANVLSVVWAQMISVGVTAAIALWFVMRRWPARLPTPGHVLALFRYGRYAVFQRLTIVTRDNLDRILLPLFVGMTELGHYAAASALGYGVFLVGYTLDIVAFPAIAGAAQSERVKLSGVFMRFGFTATALVGVIAYFLIGPVIRILLGPEFIPSIPLGQLLVVAGTLQSLKMSLSTSFKAFNRPGLLAATEAVSTVVFVISLVVLVPIFGVRGACYAQIGTTVASALTLIFLARSHLDVPVRELGLMRVSDLSQVISKIRGT